MQCRAGQILEVIDAQQRLMGMVEVEKMQMDLVCGRFLPQAAFQEVAALFAAFDEAVADQALGVVDQLDASIAALGLQLRGPAENGAEPIHDVQIYADGAFSCRTTKQAGVDDQHAQGAVLLAR